MPIRMTNRWKEQISSKVKADNEWTASSNSPIYVEEIKFIIKSHITKEAAAAAAAAAAKSLQSCPTLCDPREGSLPGSPFPGILQARTPEWVAISFSNAWKWKVKVKSLSGPTLRDPLDCRLPGTSVHGIFQARVLEWDSIAFSAQRKLKAQMISFIKAIKQLKKKKKNLIKIHL